MQIGKKTISHPFYVIQNFNEAAIMGIDFIKQHQLNYCPSQRSFSWKNSSSWENGTMKLSSLEVIPALSVVQVKVNLITEAGCVPAACHKCMVNVAVPDIPVITGGPAITCANNSGQAFIRIANCSPTDISLQRGELKTKMICQCNC